MRYFTEDELRCNGSGKFSLADGFADKLDELRHVYGKPMIVTSGCRSHEYNQQIGGHPKSSHVFNSPHRDFKGTYAVDVAMNNSADRARLVKLALKRDWCIGIAGTFIHLDRRRDYFPDMPQVIFTY
jgi:hypothetical protein